MKKLLLLLLLLPFAAHAIISVNSTADDSALNPALSPLTAAGEITLRSAIEFVNTNGSDTYINFLIPMSDPNFDLINDKWVITPLSTYDPILPDNVTIDGTTQQFWLANTNPAGSGLGLNTHLSIEINCLNTFSTFELDGNSAVIKGLAMPYGFIFGVGSNWSIAGNFMGTNAAGTVLNFSIGIVVNSGTTIGGPNPEDRNLLVGVGPNGNTGGMINLNGNNNMVQGNLINTDIMGTIFLLATPDPNFPGFSLDLIEFTVVDNGDTNTIGGPNPADGNIIPGAFQAAVQAALNCTISNNFIGTDVTGTRVLGSHNNVGIGIGNILFGIVGDNATITNNLISGNRVGIAANAGLTRLGNIQLQTNATIAGNFIGTDATGTVPLPNTQYGIQLNNMLNSLIGGPNPADANIISGNGLQGIWVSYLSAGNTIMGNKIGVDKNGNPLPNGQSGIRIGDNNIIRNTAVQNNLIANNVMHGVSLTVNAIDNALISNAITDNQQDGVQMCTARYNEIGGKKKVQGNTITDNGVHGVELVNTSNHNQVFSNTITDNSGNGVRIVASSTDNWVQANTISGHAKNVVIGADAQDQSVRNAVISNSIS